MDDAFDTLKQWVDESERIAFFGGAGVSTESGIPDFRGGGRPVPPEIRLSARDDPEPRIL